MPYFEQSAYKAPFIFRNAHLSTIYSGALKKTAPPDYIRERLELTDGDFLLIDYQLKSSKKAVILCHGLEGSSKSGYNNTAARYFLRNGYSVFAWNNRSCGGEMNRLPLLYHHASVDDLDAVVNGVLKRGFQEVLLLGFSLGGAQIMSYFGRKQIDPRVMAGVAVSTPIRLKSSAEKIEKGVGTVYANRFIKKIKRKIIAKAYKFPHLLCAKTAKTISNFEDLARQFIVPVHGFAGLEHYYEKCSPAYAMETIQTPVLVLNAWEDPIIGDSYPVTFARSHPFVYLETPIHGGHCGFPLPYTKYSYAEIRSLEFFKKVISAGHRTSVQGKIQ